MNQAGPDSSFAELEGHVLGQAAPARLPGLISALQIPTYGRGTERPAKPQGLERGSRHGR